MDAGAAVGSAIPYSREDHVHPTDTTRAPLASPLFTGDARVPTPAAGNATASIPNTAWVSGYYLPITNPSVNGSLYANGNITAGGTLTAAAANINGLVNSLSLTNYSPGYIGQAGPGTMLINAPAGNQPMISFLVAGAFGANLGMDDHGNFWIGGWSWGTNAKIWTSRDFPNPGSAVIGGRLVAGAGNGYGGSVCTYAYFVAGEGAPSASFGFSYLQLQNSYGTWFTVDSV
jgi:hypothetical protein